MHQDISTRFCCGGVSGYKIFAMSMTFSHLECFLRLKISTPVSIPGCLSFFLTLCLTIQDIGSYPCILNTANIWASR